MARSRQISSFVPGSALRPLLRGEAGTPKPCSSYAIERLELLVLRGEAALGGGSLTTSEHRAGVLGEGRLLAVDRCFPTGMSWMAVMRAPLKDGRPNGTGTAIMSRNRGKPAPTTSGALRFWQFTHVHLPHSVAARTRPSPRRQRYLAVDPNARGRKERTTRGGRPGRHAIMRGCLCRSGSAPRSELAAANVGSRLSAARRATVQESGGRMHAVDVTPLGPKSSASSSSTPRPDTCGWCRCGSRRARRESGI